MTDFYADTTDVVILRERVEELSRIRQGYAVQLGSSLFEATKNDPDLRWGRESLYDGIADCDSEREAILVRIASLQNSAEVVPEGVPVDIEEGMVEEDAVPVEPDVIVDESIVREELKDASPEDTTSIPLDQTVIRPLVHAPLADVPPASDSNTPSEPTCPQCGAVVSATDKFCMNCGASLAREDVPAPVYNPNTCPACGNPVDPSFKFCMICGHKLG